MGDILKYILKRLMVMLPTLFGITIIVFIIINLAPGSPIEQKIQQLRFGGADVASESGTKSAVTQEVIDSLKKQYGFDKPLLIRYWIWLKNLSTLDFGKSFTYEEPTLDVIVSKFPVSLQFGIVSFILAYLISIPLGIAKAVKKGSRFDGISSFILMVMYAIPPFMFGILLIVFFAGGSFFDWFPIGGLYSDEYHTMGFWGKVADRVHHFILPLICYILGQFTTLTLLMRNSLLEEIKRDYVRTARAKGLTEKVVIMKHALR
ncbi:MAG: ABC transporter permease subunit, partial [Bacteriovoracia bacterium]